MSFETILHKRPALFAKEVGLFATNQMAADDLAIISNGSDVYVRLSTPKNLKLLAYIWALATKIAECRDDLLDKDDAMLLLKREARFVKFAMDPTTGELELRPKSLARLSNEDLTRLTNRMVYVTCAKIVPGIEEKKLRDELLKMVA